MNTIPERITPETEIQQKGLENLKNSIRVSSPGIVKSFDAEKQTVSVQLAVRERVNFDGEIDHKDVPLIVDVPIFMPRAGGYSLTLPVAVGDECLVVFGDNDYGAWWQSGGVQNEIFRRRHDLNDAFAIVGIWNQTRTVSDYSGNSVQIRNEAGDSLVEIKEQTINITGAKKVVVVANEQVNISSNGHTVIEGRVFMDHQHTRVQTGGSLTGGVA